MATPTAPTILHELVQNSRRLRASSKATYTRDLNKFVSYAGTDPSTWTWQIASAFYEQMLKDMEPQSANRVMQSLMYAVRQWARLERNPSLDFTSGIELIKAESPRATQRALTQAEIERLLATCQGKTPHDMRDFAMFVTALETGMRRMSLSGMTIEGMRRDAKMGHVTATVPIKGHDPYPVPISVTALTALQPWLTWLKRAGITTGPVFRSLPKARIESKDKPSVGSKPLTTTAIYYIVQQRAKQAKIDDLHPHIFRHTFVTSRRLANTPDHQIAAITGHAIDSKGNVKMLGNYTDAGAVASVALDHTPPWLTKLVRGR